MLGPGKYDDLCTEIREATEAEGVILIIIGGNKGQGFSAQLSPEATVKMPAVLRSIADQIEDDARLLGAAN